MSECSPPAAARGRMDADCTVHENGPWENSDTNLCCQRKRVDCKADLIRHLDLGYVLIPQTCSTNAVGRFLRGTACGTLVNKMTLDEDDDFSDTLFLEWYTHDLQYIFFYDQ